VNSLADLSAALSVGGETPQFQVRPLAR